MTTVELSYSLYGSGQKQNMSQVLVMRGPVQFGTTVQHKDVKGTYFGDEYFPILEEYVNHTFGSGQPEPRHPSKFICDHRLSLMIQLAPQVSFEGLTLEDLIQSRLHTLHFTNTDVGKHTRLVGGDQVLYRPALHMRSLNMAVMPEYDAISRVDTSRLSLVGRYTRQILFTGHWQYIL